MTFAEKGASRYCRIGRGLFTLDELRSAAYEGLIIAARKFDPTRGLKFSTYAFRWIDQKLKRVYQTHKRAHGWTWQPNAEEKRAGQAGMQKLVEVTQWPVNEDGDEIDLAAQAKDIEAEIVLQQQREMVLDSVTDARARAMLSALLDGESHDAIAADHGLTRGRVQQILSETITAATERFSKKTADSL